MTEESTIEKVPDFNQRFDEIDINYQTEEYYEKAQNYELLKKEQTFQFFVAYISDLKFYDDSIDIFNKNIDQFPKFYNEFLKKIEWKIYFTKPTLGFSHNIGVNQLQQIATQFEQARVEVLELSNNVINEEMTVFVLKILKKYRHITDVHFRNCCLDHRLLPILLTQLSSFPNIKSLDLSNGTVDTYMYDQQLPQQTELHIVRKIEAEFHNHLNQIGSRLLGEVIQKKVLNSLNLKGVYDTSSVNHIVELVPFLGNLKLLNLEANSIGNMFVNDILHNCNNLTYLNLKNNQIEFINLELLQELCERGRLEFLNLSNNPIGDTIFTTIIEGFSKSTRIKTLHFNNCSITDRGFDFMQEQDGTMVLETFSFIGNDISDDGLDNVFHFLCKARIVKADLSCSNITHKGLFKAQLAVGKQFTKQLKLAEIKFNRCNWTNKEFAYFVQIIKLLQHSITKIQVEHNKITDDCLDKIFFNELKACLNMTTLSLNHNRVTKDLQDKIASFLQEQRDKPRKRHLQEIENEAQRLEWNQQKLSKLKINLKTVQEAQTYVKQKLDNKEDEFKSITEREKERRKAFLQQADEYRNLYDKLKLQVTLELDEYKNQESGMNDDFAALQKEIEAVNHEIKDATIEAETQAKKMEAITNKDIKAVQAKIEEGEKRRDQLLKAKKAITDEIEEIYNKYGEMLGVGIKN